MFVNRLNVWTLGGVRCGCQQGFTVSGGMIQRSLALPILFASRSSQCLLTGLLYGH